MNIQLSNLHKRYLAPKSQDVDDQRHELIVNILLCGLWSVSLIAFVTTAANHLGGNGNSDVNSLPMLVGFIVVVSGLWKLSRMGYFQFVSYTLLGFLLLGATQMALQWSFELQVVDLLLALIIVMASILLSARAGLIATCIIVVYFLALAYAQTHDYLHPNLDWTKQKIEMVDAIGMAILFTIIGLVTWLANQEIDRALTRARTSEAELAAERDSLELKVVERTRELEQAQLVRVMELQRLAEFGRLSAGLLHEVANPLTVASLNLEQLGNENKPILLKRAVQSLQHIERFVTAARMQLKGQGNLSEFQVQNEIRQVMSILTHRARENRVKIELRVQDKPRLYGDPVKFNQLLANLLVNAIEAYDDQDQIPSNKRKVRISVLQEQAYTVLTVQDWGRGLSKKELTQIFKPFYSGNPANQRNMGIGLAMVKQIIHDDFHGKVQATSSASEGTCFTVRLRNHSKAS